MSIMAPIMAKPLVTKTRVHKHLRHVLMLRDGTPKERLLVFKNGPSSLDKLAHDIAKDTMRGHINIKLRPNAIKELSNFVAAPLAKRKSMVRNQSGSGLLTTIGSLFGSLLGPLSTVLK